jgi:hypothetical protein
VFMIARVGDEIFERNKEKRTEPPLLAIGVRITAVFDQVGKKALRQILRILASISLFAQEKVQRTPINLAQFRERTECVSGCRRRIACSKDRRPTGGGKQFFATLRLFPTQGRQRCSHKAYLQ